MRRTVMMIISVAFLLASATNGAAETKPTVPLSNFTAIDVEDFENPRYETKDAMPDTWLPRLKEDIAHEIVQLHLFHRVMDFTDSQAPTPDEERVLVLRGEIVEFTRGSQAKRFLIGLGAGKGKIVANCSFVNKTTGEVIWQRKVDGRVINYGESTEGAMHGLAKEIAKRLKNNWRQ